MTMPNLQCPVANFGYDWALTRMLPPGNASHPRQLLDIGSRDSGFPAWAATLGYDVTACEMNTLFVAKQLEWADQLGVNMMIFGDDVRNITHQFDITTSFCALQHSADNDIECYEHIAQITRRQILITTEFDPKEGRVERGRDDGDMRVYSPKDVLERILMPITNIWSRQRDGAVPNIRSWEVRFDHPSQTIAFVENAREANMTFLEISR